MQLLLIAIYELATISFVACVCKIISKKRSESDKKRKMRSFCLALRMSMEETQ